MNAHSSYRSPNQSYPLDTRIVVYRFVKGLLLVAVAALLLKIFIFDTVLIKTEQMQPVLAAGDRVLLWRAPFAPLIKHLIKPARGTPVVFELPHQPGNFGCLRIAAFAGDTIAIADGAFHCSATPLWRFGGLAPEEERLPADFSPRDNMAPFFMPAPGTNLRLDSLSLRDFFFYSSLIAQENPRCNFTVKPMLFLDGRETPNFYISDFSLYRGSLDSIPLQFRYDWFFWDKLERYLHVSAPNRSVELACALYEGGNRIFSYTLRSDLVFLLADNWSAGLDSRYFGPVLLSCCRGQVVNVLWSGKGAWWKIRGDRLGKIIR